MNDVRIDTHFVKHWLVSLVYATGVKAMSNNSVRPAASSANVSLACALFGDSMTVA
jgi:hypothetical protein